MALHIHKPTKEELLAAAGKTLPDLIEPSLRVLFCGINPGLYSAATRHHFARPGNRFWPALHHSGFTAQLLSPFDERELLPLGFGITNIVARATNAADALSADELREGGRLLEAKVRRYRPIVLAILGISAYRSAFAQPKARLGRQSQKIGETVVWILPNPSGLNAHYQPKDLARLFRELRLEAESLIG
jgi:TDG/mug DNA glycosylase family protein